MGKIAVDRCFDGRTPTVRYPLLHSRNQQMYGKSGEGRSQGQKIGAIFLSVPVTFPQTQTRKAASPCGPAARLIGVFAWLVFLHLNFGSLAFFFCSAPHIALLSRSPSSKLRPLNPHRSVQRPLSPSSTLLKHLAFDLVDFVSENGSHLSTRTPESRWIKVVG